MAKLKMEMGAEPRKVAILVGLIGVAAFLFIQNSGSGVEEEAPAGRPAAPSRPLARATPADPPPAVRTASASRQQRQEFRPSLKAKKGEERDLAKLDPTLRLDLLQKVASVKIERVERSLFDFGANPVETSKPKLPEPKIVVQQKLIGPEPPPPPKPAPVKPPPPPINLKFYGAHLPKGGSAKRVFCLQGEEILTPAEGETIQNRYKIVRINPSSVLVEDLTHKHRQTIPIDEAPKG